MLDELMEKVDNLLKQVSEDKMEKVDLEIALHNMKEGLATLRDENVWQISFEDLRFKAHLDDEEYRLMTIGMDRNGNISWVTVNKDGFYHKFSISEGELVTL